MENKWREMVVVLFLSLEIESQWRRSEVVSRCRKVFRWEISDEGGEGGEEKVLLGVLSNDQRW